MRASQVCKDNFIRIQTFTLGLTVEVSSLDASLHLGVLNFCSF
jgi:hypothetical protein